MGNLLMQGINAENNNLVGYGQEGLSNDPNALYFINNTLVNKRQASCVFVDIDGQPGIVQISNNIFAGTGTRTSGTITTFENNYSTTDIAQVHFADETHYDYQLTSISPALNYGAAPDPVNGYSLTPAYVYVHPLGFDTRADDGMPDAGAYEYPGTANIHAMQMISFPVFPNPTTGMLSFDTKTIDRIDIYDSAGNMLTTITEPDGYCLSGYPSAVYLLHVHGVDSRSVTIPVMKR